jgi:hypothetical protein
MCSVTEDKAMKRLYVITHVNKDGDRTLTFANQGRNHYQTRQEAEEALRMYEPGLRANVLGSLADSLAVYEAECYDHGDAKKVYFNTIGAN